MNLNISTQFLSNFQGNNLSKEVKGSKNEFIGFLEDIENISEESSIDYDLILNVLSNLKNFENLNLDKLDDLKNIENMNLEDINLENKNDIFSSIISNDLNNKNSNNELVFINDLTMNSSNNINDKLLNNIINVLQSEDINIMHNKNLDIKNLKDFVTNSLLNQGVNKEINSNENNDLKKPIQVEVLNEDKYSHLEISSLNSRNNILKEISLDDKNKDLNTLESILDAGENNSILFSNTKTVNIDVPNKEVANTQPVNTIRQEFIEEDIVKTVRYLKSNGIEEIKIKISPRELGDMTIKLIKNADETNVNITITKEDVFELVNKNINDIAKHLNELNIKFKDISIDIKSDNGNIFSDDLNQEFNKKEQQENNKKNKNKYSKNFNQIEDKIETAFEEESLNILI